MPNFTNKFWIEKLLSNKTGGEIPGFRYSKIHRYGEKTIESNNFANV
jgi:hypothetical protein